MEEETKVKEEEGWRTTMMYTHAYGEKRQGNEMFKEKKRKKRRLKKKMDVRRQIALRSRAVLLQLLQLSLLSYIYHPCPPSLPPSLPRYLPVPPANHPGGGHWGGSHPLPPRGLQRNSRQIVKMVPLPGPKV